MKNFLKLVFANIIAMVFIFGTMIGFMILFVFLSANSESTQTKILEKTVLVINDNTNVLDGNTNDNNSILAFGKTTETTTVLDILEAIEHAKKDPNIEGISIECEQIEADITNIDNIRKALADFKQSGKFVYAYGNSVSQISYYLGSVADKYFLNPVGGIELKGLSTEIVYMKDFAEKYGIGFSVLRYGKYKAAIENLLRNDMSDENREQLSVILHSIWNEISNKIIESRNINPTHFNDIVNNLDSFIAESSLSNKLVDELAHKSQYRLFIKNKLKLKENEELNTINISNYASTIEKQTEEKESVAVLYASGTIQNGKGYNGIYSESLKKEIQKLTDDEKIKAVVFRINSPGGSANASDEIIHELLKLKEKKPLIISFGDYAASGGYYIAMAGDRIFSEPNTLTGSIGVYSVIPNVKELANRNGIYAYQVQTHENSSFHSFVNGLTPGAETIMTKHVETTYKKFVSYVMKNRKMSYEQVDSVAQGRVWTGKMAIEKGLVDEIGTIENAIQYAAKKANLKKYNVETYPEKINPIDQFISNINEEEITTKLLQRKLGKENYQTLEMFLQDRKNTEVMMAMPYHIKIK